jgi:serine/threonine protein kinase
VKIGPYELLGEIGRGAAGTVFKAHGPRGEVAIKLLRTPGAEARARFERERRLLASLGEEDGFVPIVDGGEWAHGPYLVMPLLSGGTLRARLERGPLAVEETLELGRALARALAHAHSKGIVHRDLKPENVLFTSTGEPRIADLGLAKHFAVLSPADRSVSLSRTGEIRGTAGYMAPEQMRDAKTVGPPADVFALGAILYECLAGVPAFHGESPLEVIAKIESSEKAPLRSLRPETPRWLEIVVARALAHAEAARFPDGRALGLVLEPPRRRSLALAGTAAAVVLVAALGAALAFGGAPPPRAVPPAPNPPARPAPLAPAPVPAPSPDPAAGFERASKRFAANDLEGALSDLDQLLEERPDDAKALAFRSQVRLHRRDLEGALADAERAVALAPRGALGWANRGAARLVKEDCDGAIADLTQAIALDPGRAEFYADRATAHIRNHENDEGLADATRAVELDPRLARPWSERGLLRLQRGDLDGSIEDSTRALAIEDRLAQAWFTRGLARSKKGDRKGAIADLERCIALDPKQVARPLVEELKAQEAQEH